MKLLIKTASFLGVVMIAASALGAATAALAKLFLALISVILSLCLLLGCWEVIKHCLGVGAKAPDI
jgi:hypothetical protein